MASKVLWYISGYSTQKEAEAKLDEMINWFVSSFNQNEWEATYSVQEGPNGFKASIECSKNV